MTTPTVYTPELIAARRADLDSRLRRNREQILDHWQDLTAPTPASDRVQLAMNHLASAYTLYDGLRTGYRVVRALQALLPRRRHRKK